MINSLVQQHQGHLVPLPQNIPALFIQPHPKILGDADKDCPCLVLVDFWLFCLSRHLDFVTQIQHPETSREIEGFIVSVDRKKQREHLRKLHNFYQAQLLKFHAEKIDPKKKQVEDLQKKINSLKGAQKLQQAYAIEKLENEIRDASKITNSLEYLANTINIYQDRTRADSSVVNRYLINQFLEVVRDPIFLVHYDNPSIQEYVSDEFHLHQQNLQQHLSHAIRPLSNPQQRHNSPSHRFYFFATIQVSYGEDRQEAEIIGIDLQNHQLLIPQHGIITFSNLPQLTRFLMDYFRVKADRLEEDVIDACVDIFRT
jgi:hypothetical protein